MCASYIRFGKLEIPPGDTQNPCLLPLRDMGVIQLKAFHLPPDISPIALVETDQRQDFLVLNTIHVSADQAA